MSGAGLVPWGAWVLALWSLFALPVLICHPFFNNCKIIHSSSNLQEFLLLFCLLNLRQFANKLLPNNFSINVAHKLLQNISAIK